jgi:hypothetical protein
MPHVLRVSGVTRWTDLNEYEGEVRGELDGVPVHCYVQSTAVEQWDLYVCGGTLHVEAWFERLGGTALLSLPPGTRPQLTRVDGVVYDVDLVVTQRQLDQLYLDAMLPSRVDLDWPCGRDAPRLQVGEAVRIRAVLKVCLADDG